VAVVALVAYLFAAREASIRQRHLEQMARTQQQTDAALQEALLMRARAGRRTGLSGCRFDSLEAVRQAAAGTNALGLRNEAIGCFALADLRLLATVPVGVGEGADVFLDAQQKHYVLCDRHGSFHFHRLSDGRGTFEFRLTDTNALPRSPEPPRSPALAPSFLEDLLRFGSGQVGRPPSCSPRMPRRTAIWNCHPTANAWPF